MNPGQVFSHWGPYSYLCLGYIVINNIVTADVYKI